MGMDVRSQSCDYLRDGNVVVCTAGPGNFEPPEYVRARVTGRSATYLVRFNGGCWSCTCKDVDCPHVAAVQMVTGHPSLARKAATR
ncbi:hypothetical protein [Streptomyces albidoflavus]|uniref:hypothetical protein n=1 Tax=Streptomyces albidoflavus TaxID=1886 RepID=UPI0033263319